MPASADETAALIRALIMVMNTPVLSGWITECQSTEILMGVAGRILAPHLPKLANRLPVLVSIEGRCGFISLPFP